MPLIYLKTFIQASVETSFNLSRSVDMHKLSMMRHKEEIVAGVMRGLMNKNDAVTWKAKHLFKTRLLKVRISEMNTPYFFCDEMVEGDFKKMKHEHYFKPLNNGTLMIDQFYFESPFGIFGKLINMFFLTNYMTRLLKERNNELKKIAESNSHKNLSSQ